jgi:hypothetical protein
MVPRTFVKKKFEEIKNKSCIENIALNFVLKKKVGKIAYHQTTLQLIGNTFTPKLSHDQAKQFFVQK